MAVASSMAAPSPLMKAAWLAAVVSPVTAQSPMMMTLMFPKAEMLSILE